MKLVDILARELKVWPRMPEGGHRLEQDVDNSIIEGDGFGTEPLFMVSERCEDYKLNPHVTRDEWQAAVDAMKASAWNGEGLPPVGTVCENAAGGEWRKVFIVAHDSVDNEQRAIFRFVGGDQYSYFGEHAECFRPIRTPEQIAAEERLKAIDEMAAVYKSNFEGHVKDGCQALYDAGYRKFEIVNN